MPNRSLLVTALTLNAALSLLTGLLLTIAPTMVGGWLGVEIDPWLRAALGGALLGHALLLEWVRRRRAPAPLVWANLAMIVPYPLLMVVLAAAVIETPVGRTVLIVDGACVAVVAVAQWVGLRRDGRGRMAWSP